MRIAVVVSQLSDWPLEHPGVEVVQADAYLTNPEWLERRRVRVLNLCRSYRYQSAGFYVSLLAAARGHRPVPALMTLLDMKSRSLVRLADEELDAVVQKSLAYLTSERFVLSVYFGRNLARQYDRLALRLFNTFPAPLFQAQFMRDDRWRITSIRPVPPREVPESHREFLFAQAAEYFARPRFQRKASRKRPYDLAILHDPTEILAPSSPRALQRFESAANQAGFNVEFIEKEDMARLPEFDALFIRETTGINHHTFRFAQRAASEGLVVIDDPQSILRCTNKVYQTEVMRLRNVAIPRTVIVERASLARVASEIGFPCVLKNPDGSFSQGVAKCHDEVELAEMADSLFAQSELLLAQEFVPSEFDWRVGVLDREPFFAARYHMARGHWQIVKKTRDRYSYGKVEPVALENLPRAVLRTAVRAANAIGDGLYGVDLKQLGKRVVVMEVNDNPNIDVGCEDAILGRALYARVMEVLSRRVEAQKQRIRP